MSGREEQKSNLTREMDRWFSDLISGTLGKVAFLSLVPLTAYIANNISTSTDRAEQRFLSLQSEIRALSERTRALNYQQNELMRHVRVIENKVLGYSTLPNERASNGEQPAVDPYGFPFKPMLPAPEQPPVPPQRDRNDQDRGALLDPTRRRLGGVVPAS